MSNDAVVLAFRSLWVVAELGIPDLLVI